MTESYTPQVGYTYRQLKKMAKERKIEYFATYKKK